MRKNTLIGVLLVVIGLVVFAYGGVTFKTRAKPVELGTLQVSAEKTRDIHFEPIVGLVLLVGGIAMIVIDRRKS